MIRPDGHRMKQHFLLHTPEGVYEVEDNLSFLPREQLHERMCSYVEWYGLPKEGRYVAVGDAGDCVIYEDGNTDQVSDSG